ncbi:MAG: polysaccharide deacetylase family protein [Candidatus Dormibacteraeota bacterium]|uniref:Polysaccharide deacetylase family protein n=2 Tax=Candidatus Dormibacteria TaxID=3126996 RepID=A0A934K266_9BACT|nr:polysaccharide deacetylase family protein [Candidatus Dormibacteraeota bacterium]MBJ7601979.1 polysaccharide deacetylase family protein [Candidatus Dormibacteraeota bacterium]
MSNPRIAFRMSSVRPRLSAPFGKPLIVHVVVNVEHWKFDEPMPRAIIPGPHGFESVPDVPNFAWAEYGMRCGMPRILRSLADRGIRATAAINAAVIDVYPEVARAMFDAGWEFMGHGVHQRSLPSVPDERVVIQQSVRMIEEFTGRRPRGWLGPGLRETFDSPDILREMGIEYVCDWALDDLPEWLRTDRGWMVALPYSLDVNDSVLYAVERHSNPEMYRRVVDAVECFNREVVEQPRILTMPLHPHLIGPPHRIIYLDRILDFLQSRHDTVFLTGSQIADWYRNAEPPPIDSTRLRA